MFFKKPEPNYDTRLELVYSYELNLLRVAAFNKGKRAEAQKKLKEFTVWRLNNESNFNYDI